jgi:hypothetical protein
VTRLRLAQIWARVARAFTTVTGLNTKLGCAADGSG